MRKKLFAVIMSVMMMVTFMPAMAFANMDVPATKWKSGFTVSDLASGFVPTYYGWNFYEGDFIYDGKEHKVEYTPLETVAKYWANNVVYTVSYKAPTASVYAKPSQYKTADAPIVKDAGDYIITAEVEKFYQTYYGCERKTLFLSVGQRPVTVSDNTLARVKNYDGKPYVLSDADFTIGGYTGKMTKVDGKTKEMTGFTELLGSVDIYDIDLVWTAYKQVDNIVPLAYYDWNNQSTAWMTAHSGLVAGDKLITGEVKTTTANAGVYTLALTADKINVNYKLMAPADGKFDVTIAKADNAAKIASNTLNIKRGSSKAVKYSATFGTAKLTKLSGNTKISVANGKVKVAKSLKKGTYKIQVKASVAGTANYASASRTKTLTIKVK